MDRLTLNEQEKSWRRECAVYADQYALFVGFRGKNIQRRYHQGAFKFERTFDNMSLKFGIREAIQVQLQLKLPCTSGSSVGFV